MPNQSRRERIVEEVVARLKRLAGAPNYWHDVGERVSRYFHKWDGDRHLFNDLGETPHIVVYDAGERGGQASAVGHLEENLELTIVAILRSGLDPLDPDLVASSDIGKLVADLKRAIFRDASDNVEPRIIAADASSWTIERLEPSEESPDDGVVMRLSIQYQETLGDPAA